MKRPEVIRGLGHLAVRRSAELPRRASGRVSPISSRSSAERRRRPGRNRSFPPLVSSKRLHSGPPESLELPPSSLSILAATQMGPRLCGAMDLGRSTAPPPTAGGRRWCPVASSPADVLPRHSFLPSVRWWKPEVKNLEMERERGDDGGGSWWLLTLVG